MPFPSSSLSSRVPSFSLATVLVEKIGKHKCHHHHNLFWISGRSCRRRNWRRGTSHAPACGSQEREREREWHHDQFPSGLQWFAVTRFRNFPYVYLYAKEASRIFCLDYGGRKICLIDLIFLTSGAFEAAIFP